MTFQTRIDTQSPAAALRSRLRCNHFTDATMARTGISYHLAAPLSRDLEFCSSPCSNWSVNDRKDRCILTIFWLLACPQKIVVNLLMPFLHLSSAFDISTRVSAVLFPKMSLVQGQVLIPFDLLFPCWMTLMNRPARCLVLGSHVHLRSMSLGNINHSLS
jgi:hypothetical protein